MIVIVLLDTTYKNQLPTFMRKLVSKILVAVALIGACWNSAAQGTVNFSNFGANRIFDVDGTTALSGSSFQAILEVSLTGTLGSFIQVGVPTAFETGLDAGYFAAPALTVLPNAPTAFPGGTGNTHFFRVFVAGPGGKEGTSPTFRLTPGTGPADAFNTPDLAGTVAGYGGNQLMPSFSLVVVPEPSVVGLGLLGAAALIMRRRKA